MATKKPAKKKPMTQKEIKTRREVRQRLRDKGILPPKKTPVNRKKFALEALQEFEKLDPTDAMVYLRRAAYQLIYHEETLLKPEINVKIDDETIGIYKLLRLAAEYKKFNAKLNAEGRDTYSTREYVDNVLKPVMNMFREG